MRPQTCILPFTYNNQTYNDCAPIAGVNRCRVPDGTLHECLPVISTPPETTSCGNPTIPGANPMAYAGCVLNAGIAFCRHKADPERFLECPGPPRFVLISFLF